MKKGTKNASKSRDRNKQNSDEEEQGLTSLTCADLKDIFSSHGLPKSGVKDNLIVRVSKFMQDLLSINDDMI